ncbi:tyrosine-type recombinase/integrase [Burkholderia ubonensis]|uniref:tyrosine-type recombinase/integrase n=1 Tax=Burkholderia ubonensis TaxID=101571 RepID=UPI000752DAD2|nr:tyrosine-type recombinase/integrase [Burkholderia ubonensis]KVM05514.1 alpha/beta hydrolase [Burkholderia ubonensis]KVM09658.1 alpha/beta hydrolase [Burkholderia ubonensis]KVM53155.1 alpha/beta hydrolase [Burkholderia ubonensis]KVO16055.1 alpha/beta hydrolase [Burkholderia ubonensis]
MRFDARTASKLPAGQHLTFDGFPGLRLQASESRRSWIYRYKSPIDDRMRQVKLGEWPAMGFPSAIAEWEQKRSARDSGVDPAAEKREKRQSVAATRAINAYTVKQVCLDYMGGYLEPNRKEKGVLEVRRMFKAMLTPIASLPAASITRAQAFEFLDGYRATPALAARLRMELGGAWDYAMDAGRLPDGTPNWWRMILRGKLRSKGRVIDGVAMGTKKRVLSEDEVGTLLRWMPNFSLTVSDAITLYLWTGARGGEIISMEKHEIAEEGDGLWWTVPKEKTKNSWRSRAGDLRVPLIGRAEAVVRRRLDQAVNGYLFPTSTGEMMKQTVIKAGVYYHQPYCKQAPRHERPRLPVTHWSPHDLRRTARTILAALGCPHDVAEAVLGHIQPGVAGVYNRHHYDRERREWLTRLSLFLEELALRYPKK